MTSSNPPGFFSECRMTAMESFLDFLSVDEAGIVVGAGGVGEDGDVLLSEGV
jgi:hypothetical protein